MTRTNASVAEPPRHVGIIMDGNGRWATARGLPRSRGHEAGAEALHRVAAAAPSRGIEYLTVFAFSTENHRRPAPERAALADLLRRALAEVPDRLAGTGVGVRFLGDPYGLGGDVGRLAEDVEARTAGPSATRLTVALNHGGRDEIAEAARRIAEDSAAGRIRPADVDTQAVAARLPGGDLPDPDAVVRSAGEKRLSNFMLWRAAYAELIFMDDPWPEFGAEHLDHVVSVHAGRERRFGGLPGAEAA